MKHNINRQELEAMIKLLDDTDEEIYSHIEEKLLLYGPNVIPLLERFWSNSLDALLQERIERLVHKIQFDILKKDLKAWAAHELQYAPCEKGNLLEGAILIARYQYPDLNSKNILAQIDKIKRDAWLELNENLTALETVKVLNHIFFDVHGFGGNTTNFHAPQNSFVNIVLESKKGNPLTLGLIYSIIAQELNIPIFGVNLPEHFVLAYMDSELGESTDSNPKNPDIVHRPSPHVLFYINAFSKGSVFNKKEIDAFLKQLKMPEECEFYEPCNNINIIMRSLRNLMHSYTKLGYPEKVEELELLMNALTEGSQLNLI